MGKLDYVDNKQINYYLKAINIKVNTEWVKSVAIIDMIILYISVIFCRNKLLYGIFFSIINIAAIITLVYFMKRVNHSQKNIYLYSGVFACHTSVCLAILANVIYSYIAGKKSIFILFVLIIIDIIVALLTNFAQYIKMLKNKYNSFSGRHVAAGAGAVSALSISLSRLIRAKYPDLDFIYVFGICAVVCSIAFANHSHLFLRYYCCLILEKRGEKKA